MLNMQDLPRCECEVSWISEAEEFCLYFPSRLINQSYFPFDIYDKSTWNTQVAGNVDWNDMWNIKPYSEERPLQYLTKMPSQFDCDHWYVLRMCIFPPTTYTLPYSDYI